MVLVTQIPALLMSTAAGMIVTRATSESNLGQDLSEQLSRRPAAILISSIMIAIFGMIPGLPTRPFFILAIATGAYAAILLRRSSMVEKIRADEEAKEVAEPEERIEDYLTVDILGVEIGYGLIPIVDQSQGGDFLDRVTTTSGGRSHRNSVSLCRRSVYRDNIRLGANDYTILIRGNVVARGEIEPGMYLAMNPGYAEEDIEGSDTIEPAFGLQAKWITGNNRERAELNGYTVVEPSSVMATHLSETIKNHSNEILSRHGCTGACR